MRLRRFSLPWSAVLLPACIVLAAGACSVVRAAEPQEATLPRKSAESSASRLVHSALAAEAAGDARDRSTLLIAAIKQDPQLAAARWHTGHVSLDDRWLSIEESQRWAEQNTRLSQYREFRATCWPTVIDQVALADFCKAHRLKDEERSHLTKVLELDPTNSQALVRLGLRWHDGKLLTAAQWTERQKRTIRIADAVRSWTPRIANWRRQIESGKPAERDAALKELRAIQDPLVLPALESASIQRSRKLSLEVVAVVGGIGDQDATESLLRFAVLSPWLNVREAAADQLKKRLLHDFVPILLSGLSLPAEGDLQVKADVDGVQYTHRMRREGETADVTRIREIDVRTPDLAVDERYQVAGMGKLFAAVVRSVDSVEKKMKKANLQAEKQNDRIYAVLQRSTGCEIDPEPRLWWQWWNDFAELYPPTERSQSISESIYTFVVPRCYVPTNPGYIYIPQSTYAPIPEPFVITCSCFAQGTKVWTLTGQTAIEHIEIGDRVLSQNPDSGELAYKPVLRTTIRPPHPIQKVSLGTEQILTTGGHLFWVSGKGWRMVKELEQGDRLHGVTGTATVESVEEMEPEPAYNLVVADFDTYFVGESRVLVHDNSPRLPTKAIVPGLMRDAVTEAKTAKAR